MRGAQLVDRGADVGTAVTHAKLDRAKVGGESCGLQPLAEESEQQRFLPLLCTSSGEPSLVQIVAYRFADCAGRTAGSRHGGSACHAQRGFQSRAGRKGIARDSAARPTPSAASGVPRLVSRTPMRGVRSCVNGGSGASFIYTRPTSESTCDEPGSRRRRASQPSRLRLPRIDRLLDERRPAQRHGFRPERHPAPTPQVERVGMRHDQAVAKREARR